MLLHPQFLYGLAGLAAPVLIHLLARRRTRRVLFPSLRLLKAAERKRRTLARLRRPLSLLIRMLAIALLVLGLAAPVVGPLPSWLPLPASRALVIVLDDSLSMMGAGGEAPFERARDATERLVGDLGPADRIAIIATSAADEAAWRAQGEAREWLAVHQPTAKAARIAPALLAAAELLDSASAPNRTLAVVTDLQATAWQAPPVGEADLSGIETVLIDAGDDDISNIAVRDLWLKTSAPIAGRPVRLAAIVEDLGPTDPDAEAQKIIIQLWIDSETVAAAERDLAPGTPAVADFSFVPERPGDVVARVAVMGGPHGLGVDDVRWATVRARPPVDAVVVAPQAAAALLRTALNPFDDAYKAGAGVRLTQPDRLPETLASDDADVVILADCPALPRASVDALTSHVQGGGGVLVFLGDATDLAGLAEVMGELTGSDIKLGDAVSVSADAALTLAEIDTTREPLAAFASPRAGDLAAMRFTKARHVDAGPDADLLAEFDDGTPAIIQWRASAGRVVLVNTSADASWGDHIRSPAYVPLLHRLCGHAARPARASITDAVAGESHTMADAAEPVWQLSIQTPDGDEDEVRLAEEGVIPARSEVGAYAAAVGDDVARFAVNVDPAESDLRRLDHASVRQALAPATVAIVPASASVDELAGDLGRRADISWLLILGAIALMLFDGVFSIIRRDHGDAPGRGEWMHA